MRYSYYPGCTLKTRAKELDRYARLSAAALGAENLIALTDIRGLMRDVNNEFSLIPQVPLSQVEQLINQGVITGGMIPKVRSCESAVRAGVKKAVMIDGRVPHSILIEMLSDEGIGTMFVKEAAV